MDDVPNLAHSLLLPIKFYWNTHRDITFTYILSTGAFSGQNQVVATEVVKLKILTNWSL